MSKRKFKVSFDRLIGSHYTLEEKMIILDWMLGTGKPHTIQTGRWTVDGIDKQLFAYSANNYNSQSSFLHRNWGMFFDAVFSRAVYGQGLHAEGSKALDSWRKQQNIYPGKFRMLELNQQVEDKHKDKFIWPASERNLIYKLKKFSGMKLKKEFHHPDYPDRVNPFISDIRLCTSGYGWEVKYYFTFQSYEDSNWERTFYQRENKRSLRQFMADTVEEIESIIISPNQAL